LDRPELADQEKGVPQGAPFLFVRHFPFIARSQLFVRTKICGPSVQPQPCTIRRNGHARFAFPRVRRPVRQKTKPRSNA
jgi:hypothetical protein